MRLHHHSFRAMNTDIDILAACPETWPPLDVFAGIQLLFEQQEARFSRFRADSLLSRLNNGECIDDPWLSAAVGLALRAFEFTGGAFNPLVLPALREAGYDRTFESLPTSHGEPRAQPIPHPCAAIEIDGTRVHLAHGAIDLGGIVKGWTVDLAIEQFADRLAGLLVNAGGDLRAAGTDERGAPWTATVATPIPSTALAWSGPLQGAMATSSRATRRWQTATGATAHHLIDPTTGLPAESPFVQATAWADHCWVAESWAKAIVIGGRPALARATDAGICILTASG